MAVKVRFLVSQPGAADGLPRYFWQPGKTARAEGWRMRRVPEDHARYIDRTELLAAAIVAAEELNRQVDAARAAGATAATRHPAARPPAPSPRATLGDLLKAYRASDRYLGLAEKTRSDYLRYLRFLEEWAADAPIASITPPRVDALYQGLKAKPATASYTVRVLQAAFAWGLRKGWAKSNPASGMGLEGAAPSGIIWPRDAVDAFVATADGLGLHGLADAVMLNAWLGQREADILRMPIAAWIDGILHLRQRKTGRAVSLPLSDTPHLAARLEAAIARNVRRNPQPLTIIVSDETGLPFRSDNFRHVFSRARSALARSTPRWRVDYLPPGADMTTPGAFEVATDRLMFMHLRHTAIVRLAELGLDMPTIAAISGHALSSLSGILERYTVRTATLARLALRTRAEAEGLARPGQLEERKEG